LERDKGLGDWLGPEEDITNVERLRQICDDLTKLQEAPGKKYLDKYFRGQYNLIMAGMAGSPLSSLDGALAQEYLKGQALANLMFSEIVPDLISMFKEQIEYLLQNSYNEEDDER